MKNKVYKFNNFPIWNFREIMNTENYLWLLKDYEGGESNADLKFLQEYWVEIFYKYLDLSNDDSTKSNFLTILDLKAMEFEYKIISNCVNLFVSGVKASDKKKLQKILNEKGYNFNHKKNIAKQLERIINSLKILKTNISQKKLETEALFDKDQKKVKQDIYKDCVLLEEGLGKKDLDPTTIVCPKWIAYLNRLKDKKAA